MRPRTTASLLDDGLTLYRAGDPVTAAARFAAALATCPDDPTLLRLHGLALMRGGQAMRALPFLARARRLAWSDPLTHLHHGVALLTARRPAQAAAVLRRAIGMLPLDPIAWINFSAALLALGQAPAARAAARRAIALAPRSAEAYYALGRAARGARDLQGARQAFKTATDLAPGFAEAWINFGLAAFQLGWSQEAAHAMERALVARPGDGAAEANLAGFLLLQGDYEEAHRRLRAILARNPNCVPARLNLGNALLLDREGAAALALFEGPAPAGREGAHWRAHRAMALLLLNRNAEAAAELNAIDDPHDAAILIAWRRLLLAERAGDAATALNEAARLETFCADEGVALLEHRILSQFDLASFRSRRNEDAMAFEHWTAGHTLMRRVQPFSRRRFEGLVDGLITAFDRMRLHAGSQAEGLDETPVFVVGLPRSGTSLTEQILASHAQVFGAGERPDLHRTIGQLAGQALDPMTPSRLAGLDAATLTTAAAAYRAELRALAPAATRIVDKMPGNAIHLGFISTLLPGARVILCRRDPRDIGLSIYQLRFFGYHPYAHDLGDLGWYLGQHERLMAHWRSALPAPPLEVELADWVGDFSGTLARVLGFLGLPHDPACATFHLQERRVYTASAEQVRQPLNNRGLGRWRRWRPYLSPMLAELDAAGLL